MLTFFETFVKFVTRRLLTPAAWKVLIKEKKAIVIIPGYHFHHHSPTRQGRDSSARLVSLPPYLGGLTLP